MSYDPHYDREWKARVRAAFIGPDARRCRCCREWWPPTEFTVCRPDGLRRSTCNACRRHCGPARARRAVERTRAWRRRLVADVGLARARAKDYNIRVGISDTSTDRMRDALLVADTSREGVSRLEVSAP